MRLLVFFSLVLAVTKAEVFTALVDLENVIYVEGNMLDALDRYLDAHEQQLRDLRKQAEDLRRQNNIAKSDPEVFLGHPVNAFQLVERFLVEWVDLESTIRVDKPRTDYMVNISQYSNYFPASEDLSGATAALLRLQDTYRLDTARIANGDIEGVEKFRPTLSSKEILMIGKIAYNGEDHYHARMWLSEALKRAKEEVKESGDDSELVSIMDYLAYSEYKDGDLEKALEVTNELLEIDPDHQRASSNKIFFEYHVRERRRARGDDGDDKEVKTDSAPDEAEADVDPAVVTLSERQRYKALCRGDKDAVKSFRRQKNANRLKCRYNNYNHPLLYLQPAKEDVIFDDPKLIVYHDILNDREIKHIRNKATPKLKRATIQNSVTGNLEFADYRISKSAWLKEDNDPIVYNVRRRVSAYTGLDLQTAEDLQVVNYGIGGHYEPHFDFARDRNAYSDGIGNRIATMLFYKEEVNAFKDLGTGNRIATVLFYMSDIEAGGATVFTNVGARVLPAKGTAVFWYNLFRNGEGNYETRHAACPVLAGSKWVSNIWIHELGQEFRRRCSLNSAE